MNSRVRVVALVALCLGCHRPPRPSPVSDGAAASVDVPRLGAGVARGVAYAHDWSNGGLRGYGTASDRAELDHLRALGVDWVCVMPFGFLANEQATVVRTAYDRAGAESDEALARTIREAHARGMKVLLKPHLWIRGSWPGALAPRSASDTQALMDSWGALTRHYAELAAREHVEALTVGVEMDPLARLAPDAWRRLIADVRARFAGAVTYSANWTDVETVTFWDALDVVSVNHYAPLADAPGAADAARVDARAREALGRYAAVGRRVGRPVWLTELGFRQDGRALVEPWAWVGQLDAPSPMDLQTVGMQAMLRAVSHEPTITGVFVWKWFSSGGTEDEGEHGFVFAHRPAEAIVREAFARASREDTGP